MSLSETWIEERGWLKIKDKLLRMHEWKCCLAKRERKRGRARGGFIIGKKGFGEENIAK